jgi:hypothetical protein
MTVKMPASTIEGPLLVKVGSIHDEKLKDFSVPDLEEAAKVCWAYVVDENLGASEWLGGEVVSEATGLCVAVVSYNGRVWMPSSVRNPEGRALADERVEYEVDA